MPTPQSRADIVIWHANSTPRFIVEVKRVWDMGAIKADSDKVRSVLGHPNTLKGGILVGTVYAERPETVDQRLDYIAGKIEAERYEPVKGLYTGEETGSGKKLYWGGGIFLIR